MGYYGRRSYSRQPRENNPELVTRIEKAAARGTSSLSDWERSFMGSLLDSAKKWGRLTAKQHEVFQRIEKKTDPAHQKAVSDWRENFSDEMCTAARFAANYYKANPPYFSEAADRILLDSSYIPSEKLYRKMVENKYVQRAMAHAQSAPLYAAGSMVKVRDSQSTDVYEPIEGNLCWCLRHSRTSRAQPKVPVNTRYFPSAQTNRLIPKNASLKNNNKLFTM